MVYQCRTDHWLQCRTDQVKTENIYICKNECSIKSHLQKERESNFRPISPLKPDRIEWI